MAASLPIVASDMPAHASIVAHGETGLLCNSPGELAAALDRLEIADANTAFGEAGRRRMTAKIGTWDDCAHRYHCVYQRLLAERSEAQTSELQSLMRISDAVFCLKKK